MRKHPIQNVEMAGTVKRFTQNKIINFLLKQYEPNLNDICVRTMNGEFDYEDYEQLMMLIGYSLSGFGDICGSDHGLCNFRTLVSAERKKIK